MLLGIIKREKKNNVHTTYGWLVGFNVGLELRSGLLPTVFDSPLRTVRRHTITILIRYEGDDCAILVPYRYNLDGNSEDITPTIGWLVGRV